MRILFCGDVVGRAGRDAIQKHLPELKQKLNIDAAIVNGENAASGFGITEPILQDFFSHGADVVTGGDHIFDQASTHGFISKYERLLRPMNFPEHIPGRGMVLVNIAQGKRLLVVHLLTQVFMRFQLECPFKAIDKAMENYALGKNVDAIILDLHGEATSEKMAMAHYLDGRVSMVVGSHTHVPTADHQIFPKGTGFQCDAGMCGDYHSVIGFDHTISIQAMRDKVRLEKMVPANGEGTLCGVFLETDSKTGLAKRIEPVRVGGRLSSVLPVV